MTPEELFVGLDGRTIDSRSDHLKIEVFSVRDEAGSRWVQLALMGVDSRHILTLRLRPADTHDRAMFVLTSWLTDPATTSEVVNVA